MTQTEYEHLEGLTPTQNPQSIWRQETGWEMIDGDTGMSYRPLYVPREWADAMSELVTQLHCPPEPQKLGWFTRMNLRIDGWIASHAS